MSAPLVYRASHIKRTRRTRAAMDDLRQAIIDITNAHRPVTVRQVFYRLVSAGLIDKTETEYKATVCRLTLELRESGALAWTDFSDETRWIIGSRSYDGLGEALRDAARSYRRSLWTDAGVRVQIWLEKLALAGIVSQTTDAWGVPLYVSRGYASASYLHAAAGEIASHGVPVYIYLLSDYDPSGVNLSEQVERRLRQFAPKAEIIFERVAVTPGQIALYNLPTRPTKRTDSRAASFGDESVELDAIAPADLREMVEDAIVGHVDCGLLARVKSVEQAERESLERIVRAWGER